jgi:methionyl aminopeptidase
MVKIKTSQEIAIMAEGGKILASILRKLENKVKPGIATKELDELAEELIFKSGGGCSFKGHQGFPACLCASVNEEIVHGEPSNRILREGDIFSLDLGLFYKGYHTDMAITLPVGRVSPEVLKLINTAKIALEKGINEAWPGKTIGDIGYAIQGYVQSQGLFDVVRELCGHGIGKEIHEDPQILNYGKKGTGVEIKEGMVLCLEPMVVAGNWLVKKNPNSHAFKTADNSLSSHFEHTVAIFKNGPKILTVY